MCELLQNPIVQLEDFLERTLLSVIQIDQFFGGKLDDSLLLCDLDGAGGNFCVDRDSQMITPFGTKEDLRLWNGILLSVNLHQGLNVLSSLVKGLPSHIEQSVDTLPDGRAILGFQFQSMFENSFFSPGA